MSDTKLKPIKSKYFGCLNCGRPYDTLPMGTLIAVGFGIASVSLHGHTVYTESESKEPWTVADAEKEAIKQPDEDWRIHLIGPLSERHYQRQGVELWVLYEEGIGFA